jgi:hypothetical protein
MSIEFERGCRSAWDRLCALADRTKRYSIGKPEPGVFEVFDDRILLQQLLQSPIELAPEDDPLFDELLAQRGLGPLVNDAERELIDWLMQSLVGDDDPRHDRLHWETVATSVVARGDAATVERFLLDVLDCGVRREEP